MNNIAQTSKRSKKLLFAVLGIVLMIVVLAVLPKRKENVEQTPTPPPPVKTVLVEPIRLDDMLQLPARVQAVFDSSLALDKPGLVAELTVDRGTTVTEGQVLLRLEDSAWKAALASADIQIREARRELDRWQELRKTGAVSTSEFDSVQTRFDLAQVERNNARVNVEKCILKSPVSGVVVDRYVELGEHVAEGAPAFRVVNIDLVKLTIDVPERDVVQLQPGVAMTFVIDSLPGHTFTGNVTFVSSAARPENNSFPAELTVENPNGLLRPGMIARVNLSRGIRDSALVLPFGAVVPKKGDYVVFILKDGKALQRLVKIDYFSDYDVVLASGIEAGEEVIVEGNRALADGMTVNATRRQEP